MGQELNEVKEELVLPVEHEKAFVQLLAEAVVALLRVEERDDASDTDPSTADTARTAIDREMDEQER